MLHDQIATFLVFCLCNIPHLKIKTLLPHNVYNAHTRVWYKWRLVSRWGMSHKIIPFLVDYIVKHGHIDPEISKIFQHSEIILPDTDGPLSSN